MKKTPLLLSVKAHRVIKSFFLLIIYVFMTSCSKNKRVQDIKTIEQFYTKYQCNSLDLDILKSVNDSVYVISNDSTYHYFLLNNGKVDIYKSFQGNPKHGIEIDLKRNIIRGWWNDLNTYVGEIKGDSIINETGIVLNNIRFLSKQIISQSISSYQVQFVIDDLNGLYTNKDLFFVLEEEKDVDNYNKLKMELIKQDSCISIYERTIMEINPKGSISFLMRDNKGEMRIFPKIPYSIDSTGMGMKNTPH